MNSADMISREEEEEDLNEDGHVAQENDEKDEKPREQDEDQVTH